MADRTHPEELRLLFMDEDACVRWVRELLPREPAPEIAAALACLARLPLTADALAELPRLLPRAAAPEKTLHVLARYLGGLCDAGHEITPEVVAVTGRVISHSAFLARVLLRDPDLGPDLASDPARLRERTEDDYRSRALALDPTLDRPAFERALRRLRYAEMLRIAARELLGEDVRETTRELSGLASALVEAALRYATSATRARFGMPWATTPDGDRHECRAAVMGMGKLGGRELNYSSDIDLIYFYETDEGSTEGTASARPVSLHEYHTRLFELVTALVSRTTEDGFCFRVDLGLRPEGKSGPICNSVPAAEAYYESWGHAWERVAWLRARPVAGDLALGRELLASLTPFVYRRSLDPASIDEIGRMKDLIDARATREAGVGARGFDLKLGRGGVREIEFFVNALQLVYGGRVPLVRDPSTLTSLERLFFSGIVGRAEQEALRDAYLLLRRVEHRIQIREELQTHELPTDRATLDGIAHGLGLPDGAALLEQVRAAAEAVSGAFHGLLDGGADADRSEEVGDAPALTRALGHSGKKLSLRPLPLRAGSGPGDRCGISRICLGSPEPDPAPNRHRAPATHSCRSVLDESAPDASRKDALATLGFTEPERALEILVAMQRLPTSPFHVRHSVRHGELCRALLLEAGRASSPTEALLHLWELSRSLSDRSGVYALLAERPPVLRLLVTLFGASPFLSRAIIRRPYLLDALVFQGRGARRKRRDEMESELARLLDGTPELGHALELCRRYHTEELLRTGLLDIGEAIDVEAVGEQLTNLADTMVAVVLRLTTEAFERQAGMPCRGLAIFGLGRLGSGEMGYGSDLDIIFVYDGGAPGPEAQEVRSAYTRLAQRFITNMSCMLAEGKLYEVDTGLRPSGKQGTLVSSLEAFRRYHEEGESSPWERQALLKCRFIAGERSLEGPVMDVVERAAFQEDPPSGLAAGMRRLRDRLLAEVAREGGGSYNVKLGRGGIMEIEFVIQYLQLRHGRRIPALRARSTFQVLRNLGDLGVVPAETVASLTSAYTFFRRLENRIRVVNDRSTDVLTAGSPATSRLARRMGYGDLPGNPGESQLLNHYRRHTETVRGIYDAKLLEDSHGRQD